jgi:hypothetical protein
MPLFKKPHKFFLDSNKDVSQLNLNTTPACPTKNNVTKIDPPKTSERLEKFIPPVFRTPEEEKEWKKREEMKKEGMERAGEWVRECEEEGRVGFR